MTTPVVHIVGIDVQARGQRRQRCAWCGAVIEDASAGEVMVPVEHAGDPCPSWQVGAFVAVDGNHRYVVEHKPGDALPAGCCALLPHEVTGARTPGPG